jgi:hypothetical protein
MGNLQKQFASRMGNVCFILMSTRIYGGVKFLENNYVMKSKIIIL